MCICIFVCWLSHYSNDSVIILKCWPHTTYIYSYSPNNTINSKKNNGSPLAAMPRFYDSEEEGAGSLGKHIRSSEQKKQLESDEFLSCLCNQK